MIKNLCIISLSVQQDWMDYLYTTVVNEAIATLDFSRPDGQVVQYALFCDGLSCNATTTICWCPRPSLKVPLWVVMVVVCTCRLSVVSVSAMVHKFKDTKLTSVALKSDKVSHSAFPPRYVCFDCLTNGSIRFSFFCFSRVDWWIDLIDSFIIYSLIDWFVDSCIR